MDPYKLLGISAKQVKHPSDLDKVRHRAKQLFKRKGKEGQKFEAKKVLEAYDLIKKKLKGNVGEGQYKLLGRSRKERELDKHFNHQTKEIKNNKGLKRALRAARHGTTKERIHLPGDKERIPRPRGSRRHGRRRGKRRQKMSQKQVNILEGLNRLAVFLPQESKFGKTIKLLYRWAKEYMNTDNREFLFKVLAGVCECQFFMDDPDTRRDVISLFEYVLGYFSEWFAQGTQHTLFSKYWHLATVLSCQCFTDDAFVLSSTIIKLNEALALLEQHREQIGVLKTKEEIARAKKEEAKKEEDEEDRKIEPKDEFEAKSEDMSEEEADYAAADDDPYMVKEEETRKAKKSKKEKPPAKVPERKAKMAPAVLPNPMASPSTDDAVEKKDDELEILSSDGGSQIDVDSGSDDVLDVDSDGSSVDVKEEIDIGDSDSGFSLSEGEVSSEGEVEEVEGSIFPTPKTGESLGRLREHFVERCLATLFSQRGPLWARPKIDAFFQDVFYRREIFNEEQQQLVEAWQSRIKTNQRLGERVVGEANNPLESLRPVIDSREMRTVLDADSNTWAAKQTFDSREASAGKIIR